MFDVLVVSSVQKLYVGKFVVIVVGKFDNCLSYMCGIFFDGIDCFGGQVKMIFVMCLQQSCCFNVFDCENFDEIRQEVGFMKKVQVVKGVNYVVIGDVIEFGCKDVGDYQLFGIFGCGKMQVVYVKVNLNIVDMMMLEVVVLSQGVGEFSLLNCEVIGFGGIVGYDLMFNGKVLDFVIQEVVNYFVDQVDVGVLKVVQ